MNNINNADKIRLSDIHMSNLNRQNDKNCDEFCLNFMLNKIRTWNLKICLVKD